jgi:hypothetical protein
MRDLFFRQTRLSIDQVERLKKRVESTQAKLTSIKLRRKMVGKMRRRSSGKVSRKIKLQSQLSSTEGSIYVPGELVQLCPTIIPSLNVHLLVCGMSCGLCCTTGNTLCWLWLSRLSHETNALLPKPLRITGSRWKLLWRTCLLI